MVRNKTKLSLALIGIALVIGYYGFSTYAKSKDLSYNELTNYIDQHYFEGQPKNLTIVLEKDVEDLHLMLFSYQLAPNFGQQTVVAAFKRLQNGKYKYFGLLQSSSTVLPKELTGFERNYGVFYGIITDNQPTKYLIDGELMDTFEKNKYFIRVYDLNSKSGFSMQAIYD